MATFAYTALDLAGPTFRLIRLLSGYSFDMIECEMIEARLEGLGNTISYEALSYTWGEGGKNKCIEVNGCSFSVTANLHLALQHLRCRSSDRLLWVDAVCINQYDPTERGHQVKQMRYIYQEAERVLIWLGPATDDTDAAMIAMMDLQQRSLRGNNNWSQLADIWLDAYLTHSNIILKTKRTLGAQELIYRPWFRRVWILQEVANARSALILCGHQSVSARIFSLAMPLLLKNAIDSHCRAVLDIMPGVSRTESWWSRERSLGTLLLKFNMSRASDPRDMVFALLGMSSDAPDDPLVQANYNKTLGEVTRDTVMFLLPYETRDLLLDSLKTRFLYWNLQDFFEQLNSMNSYKIQEATEAEDTIATKAFIIQGTMSAQIGRNEWETLLSLAHKKRDHVLVECLCEASGIKLSTISNYKRLLRLAAMENFIYQSQSKTQVTGEALRERLEQGYLDTVSKDADGQPLFSCSIETEDTVIINSMLQVPGIDVNPEDRNERTTLLYLAEVGNRPHLIIAILGREDANINSQDNKWRNRALSYAAASSRVSKATQWYYLPDSSEGYPPAIAGIEWPF